MFGPIFVCSLVFVAGCGSQMDEKSGDVMSLAKNTYPVNGPGSPARPLGQASAGVTVDALHRAVDQSAPTVSGDSERQSAVQPFAVQRQVVRKAELTVRVKEVEKAEHSVEGFVNKEGGYVESANSTDLASDHAQMSVTLRVPATTFDSTMDMLEGLGTPLSKTIGSDDVTAQLVDMDARLRNMQAEEETYRNMLRHASGLDASMQLQDKLTEIRGQIESVAGQRKTMSSLAALSTITVTLTQDAIAAKTPADSNWLAETFAQASSAALGVGKLVATALIWAAVLSPFWLVALFFGRRIAAKTRSGSATPGFPDSSIL
jgi:hypothetical protein